MEVFAYAAPVNKDMDFQYTDAACPFQSSQKIQCKLYQYQTLDIPVFSIPPMSSTPSYDSVISPSDVQAVLVDVPILKVSQKIIFHAAQALRHPFHEFPLTLTQDFYKK